jgi:hypothetical protein
VRVEPLLARAQRLGRALVLGDVAQDGLDGPALGVVERGRVRLDRALLAVEPHDPHLDARVDAHLAREQLAHPLAHDGAILGMDEIERRPAREVLQRGRPEERQGGGVREGDPLVAEITSPRSSTSSPTGWSAASRRVRRGRGALSGTRRSRQGAAPVAWRTVSTSLPFGQPPCVVPRSVAASPITWSPLPRLGVLAVLPASRRSPGG